MRDENLNEQMREITAMYYEQTDMTALKPNVVLQKQTTDGTRFYRYQEYGFQQRGKGHEVKGWHITGNIKIPMYCGYCCSDGDNWDVPDYVLENCKMDEPVFGAVHNETHDTIGWSSTCPNCRAQTYQVIDTPTPYDYEPK